MHGLSSSTAFVAPSSTRATTGRNRQDMLDITGSTCHTHTPFQKDSLTQDGTRFRPQPLAMMGGDLDMELFGLAKDVLTAAATGAAGDLFAQFAAHKSSASPSGISEDDDAFAYQKEIMAEEPPQPFDLDLRRTLSYAGFAAGYTGGFQHFLFANLQEAFPDPVARLALNQGVIIPLCYYSLLFFVVPKLRARSPQEETQIRSNIDVFKMIPRNWAFWVPLQFIQFNFIPMDYQVVYCSFLGLIWNICLSFLTAGSKVVEEEVAVPAFQSVGADAEIVADVQISVAAAETPELVDLRQALVGQNATVGLEYSTSDVR